jgi:hypothetical protein
LNGAVRTKELFTKLPMVLPTPRSGQTPTSKALGRYLASNVDKVRVLDDGTAVAIRRAPEDKHGKQQRWTLDVLTEGQPTRVSPEGVLRGLPF